MDNINAVDAAPLRQATRDAQLDAMDEFIEWALAEWGEPTAAEKARAEEVWAQR